jgi:hypothetical protein
MKIRPVLLLPFLFCCTACSTSKQTAQTAAAKTDCTTQGALSTNLSPKFPATYYAEQGVKYFQTMQSDIPAKVQPKYSYLVIRWEWPPWMLLTGFGKTAMVATDVMLKLNPTKYNLLDCRGFDTQPFCRCHVVFNYSETPCPIYEEFTFNDQGEITFIEAWSDYESLLPMTSGSDSLWDEQEYWGMKEVNRLSTKVPGLGNATGLIDLYSPCMNEAAEKDKDIAELQKRAKDANRFWMQELIKHSKEISRGCEPPDGDVYPYYH